MASVPVDERTKARIGESALVERMVEREFESRVSLVESADDSVYVVGGRVVAKRLDPGTVAAE
ncbi:hypothetical protein [Halosimplex amylolyticum]|uniref:hypothetical protein n=1 Tax=Halosimplex amylolyticum TaxID=3396616 RepID=UPI003F54DB8C